MNGTAYVDEAGEKGLVRRVTDGRDTTFGVMCAVLIMDSVLEDIRTEFQPYYAKFKEAAPEGSKIHITDAFASENKEWAKIAEQVREAAFKILDRDGCVILYDARRLKVIRESFEAEEELVNAARQSQCSDVRVYERSESQRIDDQLVEGLILKVDAYAEDHEVAQIDILFDEIDPSVEQGYQQVLGETKALEYREYQVKGWDLKKKKQVSGKITMKVDAPFPLDLKHIGSMKVVGKLDPLVLLADIVTNTLNHHLSSLAPSMPLNAPSSVCAWRLKHMVWGVRDGAIEDLI